MSFVFEDLCYSIQGKAILKYVSAHVKDGELVALMGPSGAGKTTLLRILAHRIKADQGSILLNQKPLTRRLARRISYVLQENIFFQDATLKETIEFSAKLRLPDTMTMAEKLGKVEQVIKLLKLEKCLNTVIGGPFQHGLSGGEKKRASIACELLTDPFLLLLDEPTSGLDSTNALNLMSTLREIVSTENRMAIVSIHQPSSKLFYMFDKLILVGEGNVAYFGRPTEVLDFFSSCGCHCIDHYNPADFILEKATEGGEDFDYVVQCYTKYRKGLTINKTRVNDAFEWHNVKKETVLSSELVNGRQESHEVIVSNGVAKSAMLAKKTNENVDIAAVNPMINGAIDPEAMNDIVDTDFKLTADHSWPTTFLTQYKVVSRRAFTQTRRYLFTKLKAIQISLLVIVVGSIWFQIPRDEKSIQSILGYVFFICTFWSFTPMFDSCLLFPAERMVFIKERSAGMFRISSYYLAKATSEIPANMVWPFTFFTITYWCSGIGGFTLYISFLGVLFLNVITSQALGLLISVSVKDFQRTVTVAGVTMLSFMMLGGFYNQNIPDWLTWFRCVSYLTYSYAAMVTLTFHYGSPLRCDPVSSAFEVCRQLNNTKILLKNNTQTNLITGDMVLSTVQIILPFWGNILMLIAMGLIFRSMAYFGLRYLNRPR